MFESHERQAEGFIVGVDKESRVLCDESALADLAELDEATVEDEDEVA